MAVPVHQPAHGRICILTSVHSAFDVRVFYKEAKTLADAGYEVVLIAPHSQGLRVSGVNIRAIPLPASRWRRMLLVPLSILKRAIAEKADVYHLHDPELVPLGFLLKMCGKKVIYDVHEDLQEDILTKEHLPGFLRKPIAAICNALEKRLSRGFDAILPATEMIAGKFGRSRNVVVIRNFPRLSEFAPKMQGSRPRAGFLCVYTGGLTDVRGISLLVEAIGDLDDLPDAKLVLIGKFESDEFERRLRMQPGFRKSEFMGWIDHRRIPEVLSAVDVGLVCLLPIPQFVVSLPIKLFEYMAAGLPVIASNFPLWREIVESSGCGICVDSRNPREIADAIRYLYRHPEERLAMGEKGCRAVREKYNWEEEGRRLLNVYQEVLRR